VGTPDWIELLGSGGGEDVERVLFPEDQRDADDRA